MTVLARQSLRRMYDLLLKEQYARFRGNTTNRPPAHCPSHQTRCYIGRRVVTLLLHTTQTCVTVKYFWQNIAFTDSCNLIILTEYFTQYPLLLL